jgi:hypothetical protein
VETRTSTQCHNRERFPSLNSSRFGQPASGEKICFALACDFSHKVRFIDYAILMLNWRDPKNPLSGGAERVTLAYLGALTRRGHKVYWYANAFPNCLPEETIDRAATENCAIIKAAPTTALAGR